MAAEGANGIPSVMLVDDHRLFREGLRDLLREQGFAIAGEAENAAEAVNLASRTKPDVALMDINMPGRSGIEATQALKLISAGTRVVMLTVSPDENDVAEAIYAGACGYLLKDASVDDIAAGVRAAAAGKSLVSPRIAADLLERMRGLDHQQELPRQVPRNLTVRELDVLRLVAAGKENAEIARELVISEQTVKNHVSSLLDKLEVDNRIQAAVYAVRKRLV
jgi:DNA-binding NarL/FixJ family response regulator